MFVLSHPRQVYSPVGQRTIDRFFDTSLDRLFGVPASDVRKPALDVSETDTAYTLSLDVPGVSREQLKVSVQGRRVNVETVDVAASAEAATDAPKVDAPRVLYRERAAAKYARTVSLPAEVDPATAQARFDNGVLTLTLEKKVPTGATQISIG